MNTVRVSGEAHSSQCKKTFLHFAKQSCESASPSDELGTAKAKIPAPKFEFCRF